MKDKNKMGNSTLVKIDAELYAKIKERINNCLTNRIKYPTIKSFVEIACIELLTNKRGDKVNDRGKRSKRIQFN